MDAELSSIAWLQRGRKPPEAPAVLGGSTMKLLSTQNLLAVVAVTDIAMHGARKPVAATALAARNHLPARYLEPVLQELVRVEILKGVRGPRGGYQLARDAGSVTVGDVVRATSGLSVEKAREIGGRSGLLNEIVAPRIAEKAQSFVAALAEITIADLCRAARELAPAEAEIA